MNGMGSGAKDFYTNEQVWAVIEAVALGSTVTKACAEVGGGMNPATFRTRVLRDKEQREAWQAAKDLRAHAMFDKALDIANELHTGKWSKDDSANVRAKDRAIDAFFYAAARLMPQEYSEKIPAHPVVPIQVITSLNLGQAGQLAPVDNRELVYHVKATVPVDADFEPSGKAVGKSSRPVALPLKVHDETPKA